jgi:F0F1-type ATP synthase beta subunit
VLEVECDEVTLPGKLGYFGVLPGHAALIASLKVGELMYRLGKIERFLSQPFFVAEQFTGKKGVYTKIGDTLKSFDAICNGEADSLPEQAFLYVGDLEEVREKAKGM